MSAPRHPPFSAAVSRLLATCRGEGATVAVMPQAGPSPHHFYAGVARAPAISFLEALLLVLGGDLEATRRRYDEIVVINAGTRWSESTPATHAGPDKPPEETIRLSHGVRGAVWSTWWFRRPPEPATTDPAPPEATGHDRPDPLNRRARWAEVAPKREHASPAVEYPDQIPATEGGLQLPKRHQALRDIVLALSSRSHPTLLLLEAAVLDYPSPSDVPPDHGKISDDGLEDMRWLPRWIDERVEQPSRFDLVIYSRNRRRIEAFLGPGLPRRPEGHSGQWHVTRYHGRNLPVVEYPWGRHPWGNELFSGDPGFQELDGTDQDSPDGRRRYPDRTLRGLLRGQGGFDGQPTRLKLGAVRPLVPPRPAVATMIDRDFWAQVDVVALRSAIEKVYFGAGENQPITNLLATIEYMHKVAAEITDPASFHTAVKGRWSPASSLLLWGEGGTGKSYLGKLLGDLVFGHKPHLVSCQQSGGGSAKGPAAVFHNRFFGPPAGFEGGNQLTDVGQHLVSTEGFTVVIFDEIDGIAPGDFGLSMKTVFGLLDDREYIPENPSLTEGRRISLWNTIFVLTANLASFPPAGTRPQDREAMERRVTDHKYRLFDDEQIDLFVPWHLPHAIEAKLGQRIVCTCGPVEPILVRRLGLKQRSPDRLVKELEPVAEVASEQVRASLTGKEWPLIVDVTAAVREALAHGLG